MTTAVLGAGRRPRCLACSVGREGESGSLGDVVWELDVSLLQRIVSRTRAARAFVWVISGVACSLCTYLSPCPCPRVTRGRSSRAPLDVVLPLSFPVRFSAVLSLVHELLCATAAGWQPAFVWTPSALPVACDAAPSLLKCPTTMFDVSAPLFADGGDDAGLLAAILDNALLPPPADANAAADSVSALVKQMAVDGSIPLPPPPPSRPPPAGGSAASRPPAAGPSRAASGQVMDESPPVTALSHSVGGVVGGASASAGAASSASPMGATAEADGRREMAGLAGGAPSVGGRPLPGAVTKKGRKRKEKMGELDEPTGGKSVDGTCADAAVVGGDDVLMRDADPSACVADAKLPLPPSTTAGRSFCVTAGPASRLVATASVASGMLNDTREQPSEATGAAAPLAPAAGSGSGATAEADKMRRAFMCTTCGKHFRRAHNRKVHARVHTNETPYRCTFEGCDRRFRWKSSLVSHRRWHADVTAGGGADCNSSVGGGADNNPPGGIGSPVSPPASVALGIAALAATGSHGGGLSPRTGTGGLIGPGPGPGARVATSESVVFRAAPKVVSGVLNTSTSAPVLLSANGPTPSARPLPCGEEGPPPASPRALTSALPSVGRTASAANGVPLSAVTGASPRRGVLPVHADDPSSSLAWLDFFRPDTARRAPPSAGAAARSCPSRDMLNGPTLSAVAGAGAAAPAIPADPSQGGVDEAVRGRAGTDSATVSSVGVGGDGGPVGAGLASMHDSFAAGPPFPPGVGSGVGGGSLRGSPVWRGSDPANGGYSFGPPGGFGGADGSVEVPASYPPALRASSIFPLSAPPPLLTVPGPGLTTTGMGFLDGAPGASLPPVPSCIKAGSPEPVSYPGDGGGTSSLFPAAARLATDYDDSAGGGLVTPVGDFSSSTPAAAASAAVDSFMLLSPSTMDVRLVTPDSLSMLPLAPSPLSLSSMSVSPGGTRDLFPPNVVADLNGQTHFF